MSQLWLPGSGRVHHEIRSNAINEALARPLAVFGVRDAEQERGFPRRFEGDASTVQLLMRAAAGREGEPFPFPRESGDVHLTPGGPGG